MRKMIILACIFGCSLTGTSYGQQISETNLSLGISQTSSPLEKDYWAEDAPAYLFAGATKSWHNNDHPISLRKEAGLNLQYAHINLYNGGKGAFNHFTGSVTSLFATAALQARFRIYTNLAMGIGPEAEILLFGKNNLTNAYSTIYINPTPTSSQTQNKGLNRDYFSQPSYGLKLSLFETGLNQNTTIGINISYLWTKSESSNFYASHYTRIGLLIGFRKPKIEPTPDPPVETY